MCLGDGGQVKYNENDLTSCSLDFHLMCHKRAAVIYPRTWNEFDIVHTIYPNRE